jgi:hypothetical protein
VLEDKSLHHSNIVRLDAFRRRQGNRLKPKLAFTVRSTDVDVRWLIPLIRVKVEPERSDAQNGRHGMTVASAQIALKHAFILLHAQRQRWSRRKARVATLD